MHNTFHEVDYLEEYFAFNDIKYHAEGPLFPNNINF